MTGSDLKVSDAIIAASIATSKAAPGVLASLTTSAVSNNVLTSQIDTTALLENLLTSQGSPQLSGELHTGGFIPGGTMLLNLLSTPLNASLAVERDVTFTPTAIGVTMQLEDGRGNVFATDQGFLGQSFNFIAPFNAGGDIKVIANYTLYYQVFTTFHLVGSASMAINGPTASGNALGADYADPPVASLQSLSSATDLGTIAAVQASASQTFSETYRLGQVCYVAGTRILTTRGEVAVEALRIGDLAITADGGERPIRWLGHRRLDCSRYPRPEDALPVRICANAFAPGEPARDLLLSPAHAVLVDDALVPVCRLINGATIAQIDVEDVTYWHVELDSHDLLLAEGLAAESYLDAGNRGFFLEAEAVRLDAPPDAPLDAEARARLPFCRRFVENGPLVASARARLKLRAEALGWRLAATSPSNMRLLVGGESLAPTVKDSVARFFVPAGAGDLWLVAETSRPCDVGDSSDLRDLGLDLRQLRFEDGFSAPLTIAIDDPRLQVGFHAVEDGLRRWTRRRALLPAAILGDRSEGGLLSIAFGRADLQGWRPPAPKTALAA